MKRRQIPEPPALGPERVRVLLEEAAAAHAAGESVYPALEALDPDQAPMIDYRWDRNYPGQSIPAAELDELAARFAHYGKP